MSRLRPALLVALLVVLAACGSGVPSAGGTDGARPSAATAEPAATGAATAAATGAPAAPTAEPARTEEPSASEEPPAPATPDADDPPASDEPTEARAGAEACSGSSDNRDFFLDFASRVEWPVLCAVLPRGWFVSQGSFRLANGGKIVVGYNGPGGASVALAQGAYCSTGDACIPSGTDLGAVSLGPLAGTLVETDDGFAVIAAADQNPGWLMMTEGLDQATTVEIAAALAEVER